MSQNENGWRAKNVVKKYYQEHKWEINKKLEDIRTIVMWVVATALIISAICAVAGLIVRNYCINIERLHPQLEVDWSFWTNCRIRTPSGKWILSDEYLQYYGEMRTFNFAEVGE